MTEKETYIRIANKVLQGKLSLQDVRKVLGAKYEDWYKECYSRMYNIRIARYQLDNLERLNSLINDKRQIVNRYKAIMARYMVYMGELNDWVKQNIPPKTDLTKREEKVIKGLQPKCPWDRSPKYSLFSDGKNWEEHKAVFRTVSAKTEEQDGGEYRTRENDYVVIRPEEYNEFLLKVKELKAKYKTNEIMYEKAKSNEEFKDSLHELRMATQERYDLIKQQIEQVEKAHDGIMLLALLGIL